MNIYAVYKILQIAKNLNQTIIDKLNLSNIHSYLIQKKIKN